MARRPLARRRVVTTRERPGRLDSMLAGLGADVVNVPLIAIEPCDDHELRSALTRLDGFDWAVITSAHGARAVGEALRDHRDVRLAAVGESSADVLSRLAGRPVDVVPATQTANGLIDAMPEPTGRRLLLAQADVADGAAADGLRRRGYDVESVTAYVTSSRAPTAVERLAIESADLVAFASGSAVRSWVAAFGAETDLITVAIGPSTARVGDHEGLQIDHIAADHSLDGLVAAIAAALGTDP